MTIPSKQPEAESESESESKATARERIDALLDEALMESFPASDSCAIGSGTSAIKQSYRASPRTDASTARPDHEKGCAPMTSGRHWNAEHE